MAARGAGTAGRADSADRRTIRFGGPNDEIFRSKFSVFQQTLQQLSWIDGHNIEFNIRWGMDPERLMTEADADRGAC